MYHHNQSYTADFAPHYTATSITKFLYTSYVRHNMFNPLWVCGKYVPVTLISTACFSHSVFIGFVLIPAFRSNISRLICVRETCVFSCKQSRNCNCYLNEIRPSKKKSNSHPCRPHFTIALNLTRFKINHIYVNIKLGVNFNYKHKYEYHTQATSKKSSSQQGKH
jgi:hypothetical protein